MDRATLFGIFLGAAAVLFGHVLEGGHIGSLLQLTAAIIVFGGTFGAVLVSHRFETVARSWNLLVDALRSDEIRRRELVAKEIFESAIVARKESILALEKKIPQYTDNYMQSVFRYVIDGVEPDVIKEVFETKIGVEEDRKISAAKVFSDAGGFAPTIGIIGAVLGLIHVMENLSDTSKLGAGIAVAFVATVYGVGSANLLFIPIGNKLKNFVHEESRTKEMILAGALGVIHGLNPLIIQETLKSYTDVTDRKK